MGFLERLSGRANREEVDVQAAAADSASPTSSGVNTSELLRDIAPGGSGMGGAAPSSRLYDPYEGLGVVVGGKKMMFELPAAPEFVFQEEAAARKRSWGENLQFYTGLGYLGGELHQELQQGVCMDADLVSHASIMHLISTSSPQLA
jgi:hypothetical protein